MAGVKTADVAVIWKVKEQGKGGWEASLGQVAITVYYSVISSSGVLEAQLNCWSSYTELRKALWVFIIYFEDQNSPQTLKCSENTKFVLAEMGQT